MPEDDVVESRHRSGAIWIGCALIAALAVASAGLGLALSEAGASTPSVHTAAGCGASSPRLTVQGTGQASGTPDLLTAVFSFSTSGGTSSAALSGNNQKVSDAVAALEANGVATRDLQTTGLTLQPQYAYPHGVQTLTGYQVTNTVTATLRHTDTAGSAIDAVVAASGNAAQIDSLTFSFANPSSVEDAARSDAVHQATSHATAMADAAGRSLGALCSLTDNTQPVAPLDQFGNARAALPEAASGAVPVEPGTQTQTDQVTLVYAVTRR